MTQDTETIPSNYGGHNPKLYCTYMLLECILPLTQMCNLWFYFFIIVLAAKFFFTLFFILVYNTLADRFGYDDIEPEDDGRSDFPCPYCYEDHDITSLCTHLEDEHPFESKVVVSLFSWNCECFFYLACNIQYV